MLSNIAEIRDHAEPAAETASPLRLGAITERFRKQCVRQLDTDPPSRSARRLAGFPGQTSADPAVTAIDEWRDAQNAYLARRREVEPLWNAVPDWVRNWNGVYAGRAECPDGHAVPVLARSEAALNDCFNRRVRDAESPEAVRRIEKRRREALAELRLTLAAKKGACRAAGLPFDRDFEDDFWRDYQDRIARAEAAIESTPARSASGIEARCRHAARLIGDLEDGRGDSDLVRHVRTVILRIATDVAEIAAD